MSQGASDWDPDLYRTFEEQRTRPAMDLLSQIRLQDPARIVDLGCGPGNSTECLRDRFPDAALLGLDSSEAMLVRARQRLPGIRFELGDVASFQPAVAPDLLFANAVLQWLPDHRALLPRLMRILAPGGVLAIQMPDNLDEPSHRLMRDLAGRPAWQAQVGSAGAARQASRLAAPAYYDLLAPEAAEVDVWRTTYHHPMPDAAALVTWVRSTGLRPFLDPLSPNDRAAFLAAYEEAIDRAYPARPDGKRLLAFPRLFIVARRRA